MENKASQLFDIAIQKLKEANDELCRPEEDVMSIMVCKNAQDAMVNYLRGYLILEGVSSPAEESIGRLYEKCRSLNHHFEKVNLSGFDCEVDVKDSRFCNGVANQSRCYDIADSLDTFLREENIIT